MVGIPRTSTPRPATAGTTPTTIPLTISAPRFRISSRPTAPSTRTTSGKAMVPDALAALAYDATNLLLTAVKNAGGDNTDKVKAALEGISFNAVSGKITYRRPAQPCEGRGHPARQGRKGHIRLVRLALTLLIDAHVMRGQPSGCPLSFNRIMQDRSAHAR